MKNNKSNRTNFVIKGFSSIQIGLYILLSSYLIKSSLDGYVLDGYVDNELSDSQIELFIQILVILTVLFSGITMYFFGFRQAKTSNQELWNTKSKQTALKFIVLFSVLLTLLFFLKSEGKIEFIAPVFLFGFAVHHLLQSKLVTENLLIPGLCVLLGIVCIVIPSYWYPSLLMLGIAFITLGISAKP